MITAQQTRTLIVTRARRGVGGSTRAVDALVARALGIGRARRADIVPAQETLALAVHGT